MSRVRISESDLTDAEWRTMAASVLSAATARRTVVDAYARRRESNGQIYGVVDCPHCGRLHLFGLDPDLVRTPDCQGMIVRPESYQLRWRSPSETPPYFDHLLSLPYDDHLITDAQDLEKAARSMRRRKTIEMTWRTRSSLIPALRRYIQSPTFKVAVAERLRDDPSGWREVSAVRRKLLEEVWKHFRGKRFASPERLLPRDLEAAAAALRRAYNYRSLW